MPGGNRCKGGYSSLLAIGPAAIMSLVLVGCWEKATPVPTPSEEVSRTVSFTTQDGVEIKGRLFGQGETGVILAHMYPADQSSWWEFARLLAGEGYMALTFNFRGYGEGDSKSGTNREIKLIHRDVEAALELLQQQGASSFLLIGASMGGTASLKVAAMRRVAGVVTLSAPVEFQGISLKGEQVRVPTLLMATKGDGAAINSIDSMVQRGIVGESAETVIYEEGRDHGTDILTGENTNEASERILSFLEAHRE